MYRVLVADDEKPIIEWLRTSIDWKSRGLLLVGTAENGNEAYDLIMARRPDIVVMDIKMPGMDGLEVIERVRTVDSSVEFIVVSGYSRFEFAERAVRLRVVRYLLKPLDEQDLMNVIAQIVKELDQRRHQKERLATIEADRRRLLPLAREEVVREWVMDPDRNGDPSRQFPQLRSTMKRPVRVVLVRPSREGCAGPLLSSLKRCTERWVERRHVLLCTFVGGTLLAVVHPLPNDELTAKLQAFRTETQAMFGCRIEFAVSDAGLFKNTPTLYRETLSHIGSRTMALLGSTAQDDSRGGIDPDVATAIQVLSDGKTNVLRRATNWVVKRMLAEVETNLTNPSLSLSWLARNAVYGSPDYLSRVFARQTRIRFSAYVTSFRIEVAKILLEQREEGSIAGIARAIGYGENTHYFSHVFHRVVGLSPTQYREDKRRHRDGRGKTSGAKKVGIPNAEDGISNGVQDSMGVY